MRYRFFQYRLEIQSDAGDQLEQIIFPPNVRLDPNAGGALVLTNGNGSTYTLPSRRQTTAIVDNTGSSVAVAVTDILFQQQIAGLLEQLQLRTASSSSVGLLLGPGANDSVATDGTDGADYVQLNDHDCQLVRITNSDAAAVDIEVVYQPATVGEVIPAGAFLEFSVEANANELAIRRDDQTAVSVTVQFTYYSPRT